MSFDLGNMLQQYLGGGAHANPAQAENDFDRAAQNAPRDQVAHGVTQALRSDQTPPFPQMIGQLFGNSNPDQRAGMLNQLLAGAGPALLSGGAGGILGNLLGGGRNQVTPEQASQISPDQVSQIAAQAEQHNPGIVDRMGDFYAQHPTLVKTLGGAALAIALGRMAQGMQGNKAATNDTTNKEHNMGILGDIFHKIFPSRHPANTQAGGATPTAAPGGQQNVPAPAPAPQAQPQAPSAQNTGATAAPVQQVDVEEVLTNMQKQSGQQLNWRSSIVDLLKLLNLDSSLQARKELAAELHYTGDTNDSASMNIWLHKQVMTKLAQNGGKVPADLRD